MDENVKNAVIALFEEVILALDTMEKRLEKLEEIDDAIGLDIPDWSEEMKSRIEEKQNADGALKAIQAFQAAHCANEADGTPIYQHKPYNRGIHTIAIVYDAEAPEEERFCIRAIPDIDSMSLENLREYAKDLEQKLAALDDNEPPDETSDEYRKWEYEYSEADEALEEVGYRIEDLENGDDTNG